MFLLLMLLVLLFEGGVCVIGIVVVSVNVSDIVIVY